MENIRDGSYTLYKELSFVYEEPLSPRANKFIEWVYSPAGQEIIAANGGITLSARKEIPNY